MPDWERAAPETPVAVAAAAEAPDAGSEPPLEDLESVVCVLESLVGFGPAGSDGAAGFPPGVEAGALALAA